MFSEHVGKDHGTFSSIPFVYIGHIVVRSNINTTSVYDLYAINVGSVVTGGNIRHFLVYGQSSRVHSSLCIETSAYGLY